MFDNFVDESEEESKIIDVKNEFIDNRQIKELNEDQHVLETEFTNMESVIIKQENIDYNFSSAETDTNNIDEPLISFEEMENDEFDVSNVEAIENVERLEGCELESRKNFSTTCGFCPEKFSSIEKMLKHIRDHHTKKHPFPCMDCYCSFDTDAKLKIHRTFTRTNCKSNCTCMRRIYQNFTPYKPLTKKDPVFKVSSSRIVPRKIRQHNPKIGRNINASNSPLNFNDDENLETSSRDASVVKTNDFMSFLTTADIIEDDSTKNKTFMITCNFCDDQFSSMENLFGHIKENHTKQYPYSCSSCFCSFISFDKLNLHYQTQNNCKSTCTCIRRMCMAINKIKPLSQKDPMFTIVEESEANKKNHNSSIKIYSHCNICSDHFESIEELTTHFENIHVKKENLSSNEFVYNPLSIYEHNFQHSENEMETNEKLKCFVKLERLPVVYTENLFVYVCLHCDEIFLLQVALTDHIRKVHKKFKCSCCFKIYLDSEHVAKCLQQHAKCSSHVDHNYSRVW